MIFGRQKVAETAQEIVDHLKLVDNVKTLQSLQRDLADALSLLASRVSNIEVEIKVLKSDVKEEAIKQTVDIVNSVQGNLNQRIETVSIKLAVLQHAVGSNKIVENDQNLLSSVDR